MKRLDVTLFGTYCTFAGGCLTAGCLLPAIVFGIAGCLAFSELTQ